MEEKVKKWKQKTCGLLKETLQSQADYAEECCMCNYTVISLSILFSFYLPP